MLLVPSVSYSNPKVPSKSKRHSMFVTPTKRGWLYKLIGAAACATAVFLLVGLRTRAFHTSLKTAGYNGGDLFWFSSSPSPLLTLMPEPTEDPVPTVYVVTPTYRRATQIPDLLRVAQSLMLTRNVFWILVEDAVRPTKAVSRLLRESGLEHVHLLGPCPPWLRRHGFGRGVSARRTALAWLQRNATLPGVLYFADDDNTYDHRLFDEIRWTEVVSVFPVGTIKDTGLSSPVVVNGRVIGFHDPYLTRRNFPVDMAGFAVNLRLVLNNTHLKMPHAEGRQETEFLDSLGISIEDLEALCDNATKVLVWHTQSRPAVFPRYSMVNKTFRRLKTNLDALLDYINS
ncbi:galactosylgalactosylxylosylprotein 3-beta-glucuronosyltransferase S-like [Haemaphysalis longicornis]